MAETVDAILGPPKAHETVDALLGPPTPTHVDPSVLTPQDVPKLPAGLPKREKGDPTGWVRTVSSDQLEAARRVARTGRGGAAAQAAQGYSFGFGRRLDSAIAHAILPKNEADALEAEEARQQQDYRTEHPVKSAAADVGGMLLNPLSRVGGKWAANFGMGGKAQLAAAGAGATYGTARGGPGTGPGVAGAAEDAALGFGAAKYAGTALLAGGQSALNEFGEAAGNLGERAHKALEAGVLGAGAGAALHGVGDVFGAAGRAIDAKTGYRLSSGVQSLMQRWFPSAVPKLTGADKAAAERLRAPVARDKLASRNPVEQVRRTANGLPTATLQEAGGRNIRRALRVAGRQPGTASNLVAEHAQATAENLPTEATEQIGRISPYHGTAEQRVEELVQKQSATAAREYRAPWAAPVELDEKAMAALNDPEMSHAMDVAARTARTRAHADPEAEKQFKEINALRRYYGEKADYEHELEHWKATGGINTSGLPKDAQELLGQAQTPAARERIIKALGLTPEPMPEAPKVPEVSGGALDRIRIAARNRSDSMLNVPGGEKKSTHALGSAIKTRVAAIDKYLDNVPHLAEARGNYKAFQQRIEAAGSGMKVLREKPENFKAMLDKLPPEGREDLKIAVRDVLQSAAQGSTRNALETLNKLTRGAYGQRNLEMLLGPEETDKLVETANVLRENLEHGRYVAGVGSSDTALNLEDAQTVNHMMGAMMNPSSFFHVTIDKFLRGGWRLNEHEAAAMIHLGQGDPQVLIDYLKANPNSTLGRMVAAATAAEAVHRMVPSPPPRALSTFMDYKHD